MATRKQLDSETEPTTPPDGTMNRKRRWFPLVIAPYVIGLVWHCIHPIASVFTGHFGNARRWYIDENSLDPSYFQMNQRYSRIDPSSRAPVDSLCHALEGKSVECQQHPRFEVARVVPTAAAVAPVVESVVIVVPFTENWYASQLHFSVLQLIHRLSTTSATSWLAKTILVVAPRHRPAYNDTLQSTVDAFLVSKDATASTMIRNLLVLDVVEADGETQELRILPQGRRGVLPNMDLVFLCTTVYAKAGFMQKYYRAKPPSMVMHPYQTSVERWSTWGASKLPAPYALWWDKLLGLLAFEYTLLFGNKDSQPLPHATALDVGIDSLTIQAALPDRNDAMVGELVSRLEHILRALSNLHERLHHSTSLYLLVNSERFVKHEEYLVPNLLLIVSMIVRAVTLVFYNDLDWTLMVRALGWVLVGTVVASLGVSLIARVDSELWWIVRDRTMACHWAVATAYLLVYWRQSRMNLGTSKARPSLQLVACLVGLYTHVAIAFGHVAMAFPSALFWAPLLAFPCYQFIEHQDRWWGRVGQLIRYALLILTCPMVSVVPWVFASYTPHVRYIYLPLHFLLVLLLL